MASGMDSTTTIQRIRRRHWTLSAQAAEVLQVVLAGTVLAAIIALLLQAASPRSEREAWAARASGPGASAFRDRRG